MYGQKADINIFLTTMYQQLSIASQKTLNQTIFSVLIQSRFNTI